MSPHGSNLCLLPWGDRATSAYFHEVTEQPLLTSMRLQSNLCLVLWGCRIMHSCQPLAWKKNGTEGRWGWGRWIGKVYCLLKPQFDSSTKCWCHISRLCRMRKSLCAQIHQWKKIFELKKKKHWKFPFYCFSFFFAAMVSICWHQYLDTSPTSEAMLYPCTKK